MKQLKIGLTAILFIGFSMIGYSRAASSYADKPWRIYEVDVNSKTVYTGACIVGAIYLSSATEGNDLSNYAVLVDSPIGSANTPFTAYTSDRKRSPPLIFRSTVTGNTNVYSTVLDYGEKGVEISSAATLYKTTANSGEAFKAFIKLKSK